MLELTTEQRAYIASQTDEQLKDYITQIREEFHGQINQSVNESVVSQNSEHIIEHKKIQSVQLNSIEIYNKWIWATYVRRGLSFGWKSNQKKDYDYGHWNNLILPHSDHFVFDHGVLPFIERHPNVKSIWNELQKYIGPKCLIRAYVNAYTFGTDAYFHRDDPRMSDGKRVVTKTAIVYLNDVWKSDWGGETTILDNNGEIEYSVFPKKNRVLFFNANLSHSARPLSRNCPILRAVLVFKIADKIDHNEAFSFILEKTKNVKHSNKTFFEHLLNTTLLLEDQKQRKALCMAGLYHSAYGTEFFNFDSSVDFTRDKVKGLIGKEAENIVFEFCSIKKDRLSTILENKKNHNKQMHTDLLHLEYANLWEQNGNGQYNKDLWLLRQEIDKNKE